MTERSDLDLGQDIRNVDQDSPSQEHQEVAQATPTGSDNASAQPDDTPVVRSELNETVIVDEDDLKFIRQCRHSLANCLVKCSQ